MTNKIYPLKVLTLFFLKLYKKINICICIYIDIETGESSSESDGGEEFEKFAKKKRRKLMQEEEDHENQLVSKTKHWMNSRYISTK